MSGYNVRTAAQGSRDNRIKCSCGKRVFITPEPPSDPFFTGRFWCAACGARWNTQNIAQRVRFTPA